MFDEVESCRGKENSRDRKAVLRWYYFAADGENGDESAINLEINERWITDP